VYREFAATAIVTTSWDDGARTDLRVAELLLSRRLCGTFYVPIMPFRRCTALSHEDLKGLASQGFEIGAHGVEHENLTRLSNRELARVASLCKQTLGDITGSKVSMFCYPRGRYNGRVVEGLKQAGYQGARTTSMLAIRLDFEPFEMPTSLQAYPHSRMSYFKNVARARSIVRFCEYARHLGHAGGWVELGKRLFDRVSQAGGLWHLCGHSSRIEQLGLWRDLGELLDYVSGRKGVVYIPNGRVLEYLRAPAPALQQIGRAP